MPAVHFGYWNELLIEWAEQGHISMDLAKSWYDGSPADHELNRLLGWDFNWYTTVCPNNGLNPPFEYKILETLPLLKLYLLIFLLMFIFPAFPHTK